MGAYDGTPAGKRAAGLAAPSPPQTIEVPPLPIDGVGGGSDSEDQFPPGTAVWSRQHEAISIDQDSDLITDDGGELAAYLRMTGRDTVLMTGGPHQPVRTKTLLRFIGADRFRLLCGPCLWPDRRHVRPRHTTLREPRRGNGAGCPLHRSLRGTDDADRRYCYCVIRTSCDLWAFGLQRHSRGRYTAVRRHAASRAGETSRNVKGAASGQQHSQQCLSLVLSTNPGRHR